MAVLCLTGLFDRTATADCLEALRAEPIIIGLTDAICRMDDDEWSILLKRLERAHLIKVREPSNVRTSSSNSAWSIDAHPLVREYFGTQLKQAHPAAFKAAHSRLFDRLCATTPHQPNTLDGLEPLYQAVVHGCSARRHQEACDKVYVDRILRGTTHEGFYSWKRLGATVADLSALSWFFQQTWSVPYPGLSLRTHSWLMSEASLRLRSLGRLSEAVQPTWLSHRIDCVAENWRDAGATAVAVTEVAFGLGSLTEAVECAHTAFDLTWKSRIGGNVIISLSILADIYHQTGNFGASLASFRMAQKLQLNLEPCFGELYSLNAIRLADFTLSRVEVFVWEKVSLPIPAVIKSTNDTLSHQQNCETCEQRLNKILDKYGAVYPLLDRGTTIHALVRSRFYRAILSPISQSARVVLEAQISSAAKALRCSAQFEFLPPALLTAAFYHGTLGENLEEAERLLEEAQQIAERGPMPLYLADVHLHRARLFGRAKWSAKSSMRSGSGDVQSAQRTVRTTSFPHIDPKAELAEARRLIEKHGYWRRKEELEDAEAAAMNW